MAERVAERVGDRDITHLVASPLERAQQTAGADRAQARGLEVTTDDRMIESTQRVRGQAVLRRRRRAQGAVRVEVPVEPVPALVGRALQGGRRADVVGACSTPATAAEGHEAVLVSHQLPIWIARLRRRAPSYLLPRPAQAPVHAVQPDLVHVRGRAPGLDRLLRARRRPDPGRPTARPTSPPAATPRRQRAARLTRCARPPSPPAASSPRLLAGRGAGRLRQRRSPRATRGTSPVTAPCPWSPVESRKVPDEVSGATLQGKQVSLQDFAGKPVVVNVWGSWCGPCRAESGKLTAAAKNLGSPGRLPRDQRPRPREHGQAAGVRAPARGRPTRASTTPRAARSSRSTARSRSRRSRPRS